MKYETKNFGEVEIEESETVTFKQAIFGFEDYRKFVFIHSEEIGSHITWLQSLDDAGLCFILIDPSSLSPAYSPKLPSSIEQILGDGEYICWVIAVVPDDFEKTTVNLKSPIIVNPATRLAAQIMLDQDYPIRFPLMKGAR